MLQLGKGSWHTSHRIVVFWLVGFLTVFVALGDLGATNEAESIKPKLDGTAKPDAEVSAMLVGTWEFSATNSGKWMSTSTLYHHDGTYEMIGKIGTVSGSFRSAISNSGVWKISNNQLVTTVTNGAEGVVNKHSSNKIVSITTNSVVLQLAPNANRVLVRKQ